MSKTAITVVAVALGALSFAGLNFTLARTMRTARFDLTEEKFYTLSQGSKNIVADIGEPVHLYLYFSKSQTGDSTNLQTYAQRVRELLDEYVLAGNGKLVLQQIDPEPFSEEQDRAQAAGLAAIPISRTDTGYFGLVGTNSTGDQEIIAYLSPDNERTLEYDVTRLVHTLAHPQKKVIGLVSSLPLDGGGGNFMAQREEPWPILTQLRQLFEVRTLDLSSGDIAPDVDALLVVHPKGLTDGALYAIDQFVMSGKHALVFVDPHCEIDPSGQDPSNPFAGMQADKGSNLRKLFDAWGVELVDGKVAGDMENLLPVRDPRGKVVQNLTWLGMHPEGLQKGDPVTNGLDYVIFATAGILRQKDGATTKFEPLVQTSERSAPIDKAKVSFFPEYEQLLAQFSPEGKRLTLAARVSGPAKSAFSERPKPETPEGETPPAPESHPAHVAEAVAPLNLIVFSDVDMLHERFWFEAQRFGNIVLGYRKLSNNGDLAINAMDNLAGSNDLISVRARGVLTRPFTEVDKLRAEAEQRFLQKQESIEAEIRETQDKITELQKVRGDQANMLLSPEQEAEVQRLEEKLFAGRKELRAVQRELDKDIESLGTRIKLYNMSLIPLALAGFALFYLLRRHDRTSS